jgi:hypothetical protein
MRSGSPAACASMVVRYRRPAIALTHDAPSTPLLQWVTINWLRAVNHARAGQAMEAPHGRMLARSSHATPVSMVPFARPQRAAPWVLTGQVFLMNSQHLASTVETTSWSADQQARRRSRWLVGTGVVGLVLFSVVNVWLNLRQPELPAEVEGVVSYDNLGNKVVTGPVVYGVHPPVGGAHAELPHLCGVYRVPLVEENAVASLATGAVWVAYRPDLQQHDVDRLRETFQGEYDVIMAPYPGLDAPIVLSAWGRQLRLDDPGDERVQLFAAVYRNQERAPNNQDHCAAGIGLPLP